MKIRADEHVSPRIDLAIKSLGLRPGWELSHVRDDNGPRTADETWLPRFAAEGGSAILSADGRMLKRPHQLVAVRDSGLVCVVLPDEWAGAKKHEQAAHIIYWWSRIEDAVAKSKPGDCWRVPFKFDRSTNLVHKKIDYEKAAKAVSK